MKAIVSLFISAYQPGMASIECRADPLNPSRQPLLFSDSDGFGQVLNYEAGGYKESQMEGCYLNEDECGDVPSNEDICWMISRVRRSQPLGYCVMYLRYVSHHSGYAKTVEASLRQHIALHPNLKESLSTLLATYLQQHEDLFCQTLHQQLIEFHTSR
ncbi:conserved hypothetical protein [Vibrio crassostreae]|uniref:hypothetical protein n=1 Tax=Vibrio crassostreae TaxID=246167 RepID=UPI0005DFF64E|nr:hypothetical protein [Vibrio crassostreae]TCT62628.1 hypothetical protein EDB44_10852 [Vibrio crassostreae]TCT83388.1 hypothetical protein EDB43_10853 [Vibrio crassostreae]TCU03799.1 hypothetical protein EDB47_10953 [Vibrio crassostreae]TDW09538.1 hypothetical protein EDB45_10752 [Vibrio crassostreae]CAK2051748.1 conserved hypothetical protein [Vibrio crassostreae]